LALADSLKSKADSAKAMSAIFYVLADISNSILFKSKESELPELRKMFLSLLGTILLNKESPNYSTHFEKLELLRIRSELIDLFGKFR